MIDIRHGDWRTVLADVTCDAVICDPPYGERTHAVVVQRADGWSEAGLAPGYEAWTPEHVREFVQSWSPRCRGWMACLTSHDLIPAWEQAYLEAGRYSFAPVGVIVSGMSVRMLGDGPSSWTLYLMAARPRTKAMTKWGTLPGGYSGPANGESGGGRGKPPWLMQAIVRDYSRPGEVVVDPFTGWGATFEACEALGRSGVGAEVDAAAHAEAVRRLGRPLQIDMFGGAA